MSRWRTDARTALAGVLVLQLVITALIVLDDRRTGASSQWAGHAAWTVLIAALLWLIWAHRSAVARGALVLAIGLPLVLLMGFSAPGLLVLALVVLSAVQLGLLWSPAVRDRVRPRREDIPHF